MYKSINAMIPFLIKRGWASIPSTTNMKNMQYVIYE